VHLSPLKTGKLGRSVEDVDGLTHAAFRVDVAGRNSDMVEFSISTLSAGKVRKMSPWYIQGESLRVCARGIL
jgi:hypothetical protein